VLDVFCTTYFLRTVQQIQDWQFQFEYSVIYVLRHVMYDNLPWRDCMGQSVSRRRITNKSITTPAGSMKIHFNRHMSIRGAGKCLNVFTIQWSEQSLGLDSASLCPPQPQPRALLLCHSSLPHPSHPIIAYLALRGFASSCLGSHPHLLR
jgi:hypothetical protein